MDSSAVSPFFHPNGTKVALTGFQISFAAYVFDAVCLCIYMPAIDRPLSDCRYDGLFGKVIEGDAQKQRYILELEDGQHVGARPPNVK